jgi:hypothetical protein
MAAEYKHKRYLRIRKNDNTLHTFVDMADCNAMIILKDAWTGNNATVTRSLEDSNATCVLTIEHPSDSDQTAWKTAVDNLWVDGVSAPWDLDKGSGNAVHEWNVEHFKTEWLHADGSVSTTTTLIS